MGEWKTIDTAPKNGEFILLFSPEMEMRSSFGFYDEDEGSFKIIEWDSGYSFCNPTHWMPLPDAPTNSKEGI